MRREGRYFLASALFAGLMTVQNTRPMAPGTEDLFFPNPFLLTPAPTFPNGRAPGESVQPEIQPPPQFDLRAVQPDFSPPRPDLSPVQPDFRPPQPDLRPPSSNF